LLLRLGILNGIQYNKEEHQNKEYQGVETNLSPIKITDFVEQIDPRVPFKIATSLKPTNNKRRNLGVPIFNTSLYSMTYNSSAFCHNKNELPIVIDSGTSKSITQTSSEFIGKISPMYTPIQGHLLKSKV